MKMYQDVRYNLDFVVTALELGNFQVYLQPEAEILTGRPVGAEALVRWMHPEFGSISPADFIPALEKNGVIYSMDLFVWNKTCKIIRAW